MPQGVRVGPPFSQFSEAARIFAIDVFPGAARTDEKVGVVGLRRLLSHSRGAYDMAWLTT